MLSPAPPTVQVSHLVVPLVIVAAREGVVPQPPRILARPGGVKHHVRVPAHVQAMAIGEYDQVKVLLRYMGNFLEFVRNLSCSLRDLHTRCQCAAPKVMSVMHTDSKGQLG